LAWSWLMTNSPERAESHFRLAVELNPFDSESLIAGAMGYAFLGQLDQARSWAETALQLNPLHPDYFSGYLAAIRYLHGDYAGTLNALARSGDVFPEMRAWAAAAHAMLGHREEAVQAFDSFLVLMKKRWEGTSAPDWEKIHSWLEMAVPIRWQPGKAVLDAGLERAKAWHHAAGLQGEISGISA
jgi:tetratricopeptide (TPR) repeat protein